MDELHAFPSIPHMLLWAVTPPWILKPPAFGFRINDKLRSGPELLPGDISNDTPTERFAVDERGCGAVAPLAVVLTGGPSSRGCQ